MGRRGSPEGGRELLWGCTAPRLSEVPKEILQTRYDDYGLPSTLNGTQGYVQATDYTATGKVRQLTLAVSLAAGVKKAYLTNTWDEGTDRLKQSLVTDDTHPWQLQQLNYGYDQAGDVTSITDPTTLGGTSSADNQCFTYDGYQRLTEAWTPKSADCSSAGRTASNLGGPAPYWTAYAYNTAGQRTTETQHTTAGSTSSRTYCYTATGHQHALTATPAGTAAGVCTGVTAAYAYDATGSTTGRPDGTATQSLTWDAEGRLGSLKETAGSTTSTTGYLYGVDGSLLIRRNTTGETVLYVGVTEVHYNAATGKKWAQRSYTLGGTTVAVRSNRSGTSTLTWLAGDDHDTASLALTATDQAITRRYTTPFGTDRGTAATNWPDDKKFLGKAADAVTGLTHIGAREYDPSIGQFISVDPVLQAEVPQTLNGYTYGSQNPVTRSDETGLAVPECMMGVVTNCRNGVPTKDSVYHPERDPSYTSSGTSSGPYADTEDRVYDKSQPTRHDRKVEGQLRWVQTGLWAKGWSNAYALLSHWLDNTGTPFRLDPSSMIDEIPRFKEDVKRYLLGQKNAKRRIFDSGWKGTRAEESDGDSSLDWYYGLNHFQWRVSGTDLPKHGMVYTLQIRKRYDWGIPSEGRDNLDKDFGFLHIHLSQPEIAHLHTTGVARDFDVYGSSSMKGTP
ncbi:RHS repeat-associated core domain-containing protein [Streptomyces sp. NPDC048200]|uniref:RHS repeat-associated core domain-containing protein n=1 Tax=Streptomyces sp. NPDC048200 TaxID=3365512 RepID=UPI003724A713